MRARAGLALLLAAIAVSPAAHGNAQAIQERSTRLTIVLSDLHMGLGRAASGEWSS